MSQTIEAITDETKYLLEAYEKEFEQRVKDTEYNHPMVINWQTRIIRQEDGSRKVISHMSFYTGRVKDSVARDVNEKQMTIVPPPKEPKDKKKKSNQ